ncbi:MAG: type II toxin-antitoxin system RelE/ParE family toxin [Isosphaeraceae bacterium]
MEVIWLEGAFLDSRRVREHIRQFNPLAAQKTVGRIEKAAEQLSRFPAVGRVGEVLGTRELVITVTPYFLVYRARGDRLEILRVFHSKQQWPQPI